MLIAGLVLVPAVAASGSSPEATHKFKEARDAYDKGRVEEAVALYTAAIQIDPGYVEAYYERSRLHKELKAWDKEFADLNSMLVLDAKHLAALRRRGDCLFSRKQYLDAELDYSAAIKIDRNNWYTYYMRGRARVAQGYLESALKDFDQAIREEEHADRAFYERGKVYLALGKRRKAENDFEEAIEIDDENAWAYLELGKMRLADGKHEEALKLITNAERHSEGKYGQPLFWRGNVYGAVGDWEHALEDYASAIGRKYDTAELRYSRAAVYYELGELEEARDDLKAALEKAPDNAQCTWALERVENLLAQENAAEAGDAQNDGATGDDEAADSR